MAEPTEIVRQGDVKWRDTSLEQLITFDLAIFGTAMFMSVLLFFFGEPISAFLGYALDFFFYEVIPPTDPVNSLITLAVLFAYAIAILLAILYLLYHGINFFLIKVLKLNQVPQVQDSCEYKEYCYVRTKWNRRTNKLLFGTAVAFGLIIGFIIPGYLFGMVDYTAEWVFRNVFAVLAFALPIHRLLVIASDVSYYAYYDPSLRLRKTVYIIYIIILTALASFFGGLVLYQNIQLNWEFALTLPYIIGYVVIGLLIAPDVIIIRRYLKLRKAS